MNRDERAESATAVAVEIFELFQIDGDEIAAVVSSACFPNGPSGFSSVWWWITRGSVGISLVTTLTQRRAQVHQDTYSMHVTTYNPALRHQLAGLSNRLFHAGMSSADARHRALGSMYVMVQSQASIEAYLDTLKILAIVCLCMLPIMPLLKGNDPHAKRAVGAH